MPELDPDAVARQNFPTGFRGFEQAAVRAFLNTVAEELRTARQRAFDLSTRLADAERRAAAIVELDEAKVTELLGEEAARVLSTAREAAAQIRSRAEENVARMVKDANDELANQRAQLELEAARQREAAEAEAERLRQDALAVVRKAEQDAAEIVQAAERRSQEILAEAQATRERLLADLARRRQTARVQVEALKAGRDRLLAAYDVVQRTLVEVTDELRVSVDEARSAAQDVLRDASLGQLPEGDAWPAFEISGEVAAIPVETGDGTTEPAAAEEPGTEASSEPLVLGEVPEPEPIAEEAEDAGERADSAESAENGAEPGATVDDLFARMRASRAERVAQAHEVLAHDAEAAVDAEDEEAAEKEEDVELDPVAALFGARDAALDPVMRTMARHLRRVLADEQNEVLHGLRRSSRLPALEDLVGPRAEHGVRYRSAAEASLQEAAVAGVLSEQPEIADPSGLVAGDPVLADLLGELERTVTDVLRDDLERAFAEADGDVDSAGDAVRALYREWKTRRLNDLAEHLTLSAYNRGAYLAIPDGSPVCWYVAAGQGPCPDAEDNALAGAIAKGTAFPTGHLTAPAHAGCRCQVARPRQ